MIVSRTALGVMVVVALATGGCGAAPVPPSPSAVVAPTATPPTAAPVTASATAPATPAVTSQPVAGPVEEDEGLLAILPEDVSGTPVQLEHLAFTDAASDPAFAASIGTAAFFVAPGTDDIVSGLVAKPRDGVYSDAWLLDWRETYQAGACAQAGGVGGTAEAEIGGRPVSITTCAGGMRVYQAWVAEQGVVVSLLSLGEHRWGEQLMTTLRP